MAAILKGAEVTAALNEKIKADVDLLKSKNIVPALAILRVGEKGDDIAYERGIMKRCEATGVLARKYVFDAGVSQNELLDRIYQVNRDPSIHGVLIFRPLPGHLDENSIRNALCAEKDIDGITDGSLAGVFSGTKSGFPPCTAQACMEVLDYYNIELKGKKVVVIGRSLVVGKPVAMMLLGKNATVTMCHTKTQNMPTVCREADILIAAAGRANLVDGNYISAGQVVLDVGINVDENGNLCGDVNFKDAEPLAGAITPVPGGVGTVTASVLVKHVVMAAQRML